MIYCSMQRKRFGLQECKFLTSNNLFIKEYKKKKNKQRPESVSWHVCLLHDNRSSHTSELVKQFLKSEKVTVLSRPPYFPGDLSVCDFFLSQNFLKTFLSGRRYKSELAFGSAMNKWLRGLLCISNREEYIS